MYFLISGEGNSDLGFETDHPGYFVAVLQTLSAAITNDEFSYEIIPRTRLSDYIKSNKKLFLSRGLKNDDPKTAFCKHAAYALAEQASVMENTGAVLFHDCDYSNSEVRDGKKYYRQQVMAIQDGFALANGFKNGVPMVPCPRSESWLLCFYQDEQYKDNSFFDDLPANDTAENSGKKLLADFFGCKISEIYDHIHMEEINWDRIKAPSFLYFKSKFQRAVQRLCHVAITVPEEKLPYGRMHND